MDPTNQQFRCLALLLVLAIFTVPATAYHLPVLTPGDDVEMSLRHEQWIAQHRRAYKDVAEKAFRFKIFKQNAEYIDSVNRDADC